MKKFIFMAALASCLVAVPVLRAGDGGISHVYTGSAAHLVKRAVELAADQDSSIEDIARALYEALKADPDNAVAIVEEVLDARPDWTPGELIVIVDTTIVAVPDVPSADLKDVIGEVAGNDDVANDIVDNAGGSEVDDTANNVNPSEAPPEVPIFPVVPSPGDLSAFR